MRLTHRLSLSLIFGVASVSLAVLPDSRGDPGLEHDLESQALVLAESLSKSVEPLVLNHSYRELKRLVDRFKDREKIAGIAV